MRSYRVLADFATDCGFVKPIGQRSAVSGNFRQLLICLG
jgi:hypothetical protein